MVYQQNMHLAAETRRYSPGISHPRIIEYDLLPNHQPRGSFLPGVIFRSIFTHCLLALAPALPFCTPMYIDSSGTEINLVEFRAC